MRTRQAVPARIPDAPLRTRAIPPGNRPSEVVPAFVGRGARATPRRSGRGPGNSAARPPRPRNPKAPAGADTWIARASGHRLVGQQGGPQGDRAALRKSGEDDPFAGHAAPSSRSINSSSKRQLSAIPALSTGCTLSRDWRSNQARIGMPPLMVTGRTGAFGSTNRQPGADGRSSSGTIGQKSPASAPRPCSQMTVLTGSGPVTRSRQPSMTIGACGLTIRRPNRKQRFGRRCRPGPCRADSGWRSVRQETA